MDPQRLPLKPQHEIATISITWVKRGGGGQVGGRKIMSNMFTDKPTINLLLNYLSVFFFLFFMCFSWLLRKRNSCFFGVFFINCISELNLFFLPLITKLLIYFFRHFVPHLSVLFSFHLHISEFDFVNLDTVGQTHSGKFNDNSVLRKLIQQFLTLLFTSIRRQSIVMDIEHEWHDIKKDYVFH